MEFFSAAATDKLVNPDYGVEFYDNQQYQVVILPFFEYLSIIQLLCLK
jgi:hypothetical protein